MSLAVHRKRIELGVEREWGRSQAKGLHLCSWSGPYEYQCEPRRGPLIRLAVGLSVRNCVWPKQNRSLFPSHIKELWRPRLWWQQCQLKTRFFHLSAPPTLACDFHSFILRSNVTTRALIRRKVRVRGNTAHLSQSPIRSFPRSHI